MQKMDSRIFTLIYQIMTTILNIPIFIVKYFSLGVVYTLYFIATILIAIVSNIIKYFIYGFAYICSLLYQLFKMIFKLLIFACYLVYRFLKGIVSVITKPFHSKKKENTDVEPIIESEVETDSALVEETDSNAETIEEVDPDVEISEEAGVKNNSDIYLNKNVKIERELFSQRIKKILAKIGSIPKSFYNKIANNAFAKHRRNKRMMQREALLIDFDGADALKSETKELYEYVAKDQEGHVIKDYFEAFSKVEVHSYLLGEGFEVYSIKKASKWTIFIHGKQRTNTTRIKIKDLIFFITQLSTYLKAGIPLVDALKILSRQFKNKKYQKIFKAIIYDLTMGENFSDALNKQNVAFPRLFINMVKTAEMTGELPEVLDDMYDYYTETEKTRKQMITAMMYPSLVFIFSVAVITFIMMFVIPQFVEIYSTMDESQIPGFTKAVIAVSDFLQSYIVHVIIGLVLFVVLFMYLYKKARGFRTIVQWVVMHLPVFGDTVIYNEVTMFTKTFSSLLAHNVFITDSMEILNKITNNEIYKMLILDTITNLAKGDKISTAFAGHWAFPIPAYEMLVTGEKTGELAEMMAKVSAYYQELHKESVTRIKTFIEPILTIFLTVVVGSIVLAIVIPMFGMYSTIQNYG